MLALGTAAVAARLLGQIGPAADPVTVTIFGVAALATAVIIFVIIRLFEESFDVDRRMHAISDLRSHYLLDRFRRKRRVHDHRPPLGKGRKKD